MNCDACDNGYYEKDVEFELILTDDTNFYTYTS